MNQRQTQKHVRRHKRTQCLACAFSVPSALAVHHKIPRSLGGSDAPSNLCVLCSNCHRLVHSFSIGRRLEGTGWQHAAMHVPLSASKVIANLAKHIRVHRERMIASDNSWIAGDDSRGSVDLQTAIEKVAARSDYEGAERNDFVRAIRILVSKTPAAVLERCSVRLLKGGRYLRVNAGNHLLFRLPAYSDAGTKQDGHAFIVWPSRAQLYNWSPAEQDTAVAFRFQLFDGVNLRLIHAR